MELSKMKEKWFRRDNLLILVLSGVLLFVIAMPVKEENAGAKAGEAGFGFAGKQESNNGSGLAETNTAETAELGGIDGTGELERRLEEVLSEMAGVGQVKVMITLEASEELVVEKDEALVRSNTNESDSTGGNRIVNQIDTAPTTVYQTNGSDSEPYVVKTLSPRVEGVVVVAQGAGDGTVNKNITEMVQALFGVDAHKVKVVKMTQKTP